MAEPTSQNGAVSSSSTSSSKTKNNPLLLGRFEIGKLLGHGTFAKVYHARNIKTDEGVAIKVIDKEKILKGGLIAHIKCEIPILRRVRHPNIVQLFEVMATKAKIYVVMEYVRGGKLFNKVAKGPQALKPENLLDENDDIKVSDFGLSAVSDEIRQNGLFHTFCGTPATGLKTSFGVIGLGLEAPATGLQAPAVSAAAGKTHLGFR